MIRLAREGDIDDILPYLREQELETISRLRLDVKGLVRSALGPYAFSGLVGDRVACMWGLRIVTLAGGYPRIWLLTTPLIEGHRMEFLRVSKSFIRGAVAEFGPVVAMCDKRNEVSMAWLKWLKFEPFREEWPFVGLVCNGN
jgi:hypothetical protein